MLEAWGAVDVAALHDEGGAWNEERFEVAALYLLECLNMVLVELSYQERRVLGVTLPEDTRGGWRGRPVPARAAGTARRARPSRPRSGRCRSG